MSEDHRANQITVTCPNCHDEVTLTVEVSYLFSQPKSLSAQIGRCRGDHDCSALRPKRGRPRTKTPAETTERTP